MRRAGAVLALALLLPAAARAASFDYLYIDANEGGSSGGHAAIRFGDLTFHYQHRPPGILRLERERAAPFERHYAVLENRTIHVSRIAVSDDTYTLLRDEFTRRHLVQSEHLRRLETLRRDRALLEAMGSAAGAVPLGGAGLFFATVSAADLDGTAATVPPDPTLVALRERVLRTHGPGILTDRAGQARRRVAEVVPDQGDAPPIRLVADEIPPGGRSLAARHEDAFLALLALEVLRTARPPRHEMTRSAASLTLAPAEHSRVRALAAALETRLVELVGSQRPDWGSPFLLGMARLAALGETEARGRWVFLDAYPPGATVLRPERLRRRGDALRTLADAARADLERARARLPASGFPEARFAALETAANRFLELERALGGDALRLHPGPLLPSAEAPLVEIAGRPRPARALAAARTREEAYEAALVLLYGYHLMSRNCVSEIFRTIDAALARTIVERQPAGERADATARRHLVRAEATARLGGHVATDGTLNFIPFVSARAVGESYAVAERTSIPSYRQRRLARMYERENGLRVYFRESNTLTSTVYRRNPEDSLFLFFTDDRLAPRPVLGTMNLLTAVGGSAVGLLTLPADRGEVLRAGLRGALFSLPELAFLNVRKGSFPYVTGDGA